MINPYYQKRLLLLLSTVIAFVAFRWLGELLGIPATAVGFNGSILANPGGVIHLIVVVISIVALVAVNAFIVGRVRADAAVFCVALGLIALSLRAGETRFTLFGQSSGIWFTMVTELVLLGAAMLGGWVICHNFHTKKLLPADEDAEFDDVGIDARALSIGIHAFAMIALMSLFCRSDARVQCLLAVGISGMLASMVTHLSSPMRPSIWFWVSPILVGVLGYIWASFSPGLMVIGQPGGYFASLARPLPVDYAGTGIAGSMLGYWFARAWARGDEATSADSTETEIDPTVIGI